MAYYVLDRLHLVDVDGVAAEVKEVAKEYRLLLVVDKGGKLLVCIVVARACCKLQRCDGLWVPCVPYAVLAVVELSVESASMDEN